MLYFFVTGIIIVVIVARDKKIVANGLSIVSSNDLFMTYKSWY